MSLYGALYSGVSGLSSESSAMGAIADNVTNINTIGYKGTDVNFNTLVTQQVSLTQYSPGGVESKPRAGIDVQGLLQATSSSTDIALSGQGFFVVNSSSNPAVDGGQFAYTRAGSFISNQNGFLQNTSGEFLMGWPLTPTDNSASAVPSQDTINGTTYMKAYKNPDGTFHYINQNIVSDTELQPLNLNQIGGTAQSTSNISLGANLPSGDPIYDPTNPSAGGIHDTNVLVYDSLGDSSNAQFQWTKIGANAWSLAGTPPAGAAVANLTNTSPTGATQYYASQGQLEFNSVPPPGSYFTMSSVVGAATTASTVKIQFYNSGIPGVNATDPTNDTTAGTAAAPYVLGVDENGVTDTTQLATAIQNAITSAANSPTVKGTYNTSNVLLGGVATGAARFVANANVLQIQQQPNAQAINVNCISNATTGLGNSIVESGTGVGSGALTTGTSATAGQFTIQAINPNYTQIAATQESNSFTFSKVPSASGVNAFNIVATPPSGSLTINLGTKSVEIPWSSIAAGTTASTFTLNGTATNIPTALPNAGAATVAKLAQNAASLINELAGINASGFPDVVATSDANGNVYVSSTTSTLTLHPDATTAAPAAVTTGVAGETTWEDGNDGFTKSESVTPAGVFQVGNTQVSWSQITSGQVLSYTNAATGVTTQLLAPVTLTTQPNAASDTFTLTGGSALPLTGNLTINTPNGLLSFPWSAIDATGGATISSYTLAGSTVNLTTPIALPNGATPTTATQVAANLVSVLGNSQITSVLPSGFTVTNTAGAITFSSPNFASKITPGANTNGTWSWNAGTLPNANQSETIGVLSTDQAATNAKDAITGLGTTVLSGISAKVDTTNLDQIDLTSGSTPTAVFANNQGAPTTITWSNGTDANTAADTQVMGQIGAYIANASGAAITFNGDGTPASIIPTTMQLFWANGAENQDTSAGTAKQKPQITIDLGSLNQANGVTQLGGDYQVNFLTQDGAKFGNFSGVSIGTDGVVTALFDNGVRSPVFQIPIATFPNPDGMESETGNTFIDTTDSGSYTLRVPGTAGSGTVAASSLEASTVDLGTEFTQMITVQRAYSAAAKIITTTDQMLSDLINVIPQ